MSNNDWQSALQSLLNNPDLPQAIEAEQPQPTKELHQTGKLTISYEKKGRAGKSATIISGFTLPNEEVEQIASQLKSRLGTGGSARGGEILIQGDRRDDVRRMLQKMGFKA